MYAIIKRCFDIILSLLLLILLSPLLMVIILTIRLTSSCPAVFSQILSGKNEKRFVIYKFRTM
ncbi:MAG: sugar transferase, partial [Clostridia bacterium]|nr:sugar transferase [Clostridia bacterium]